jgi:hypothetical protein
MVPPKNDGFGEDDMNIQKNWPLCKEKTLSAFSGQQAAALCYTFFNRFLLVEAVDFLNPNMFKLPTSDQLWRQL